MNHVPHQTSSSQAVLQHRLAALRGPGRAPRPLDSRALTALAANPGCGRRALLDSAGVDKSALAGALGSPSPFGQSQFAFARGHSFEARAMADGGGELVRLLCARTGQAPPEAKAPYCPELAAEGPAGRCARTAEELRVLCGAGAGAGREHSGTTGDAGGEPAGERGWSVLVHPMLRLEVAGVPVYLEPDALVVDPDGRTTVVEIKSFPILDGAAAPTKVGAAARQSAVYALALDSLGVSVAERALLVCPRDFSNLPTAALVDIRKQRAAVRRQLSRLTRVEAITATLPERVTFDLDLPSDQLADSLAAVPAAYAPECLASCDLAFHCRAQARAAGEPAVLGRSTRAELGGLTTVEAALAAASGAFAPGEETAATTVPDAHGADGPAVAALRRAAKLRAEALGQLSTQPWRPEPPPPASGSEPTSGGPS